MKKELSRSAAEGKTVLVLVGRGKSVLTTWMIAAGQFFGLKQVLKKEDKIKELASQGGVIIHLQSEDEYKLLSTGIKRRAIMFKVDF